MELTTGPGWVGQNKLFDPPEAKPGLWGSLCGAVGCGDKFEQKFIPTVGRNQPWKFRLKKVKLWSKLERYLVVQIWVSLLILWTPQG